MIRIRSLQTRILVLIGFLAVPVFFVVFDLYLAKIRADYGRYGAALEATERKFLELVVNESKVLPGEEYKQQFQGYHEIALDLAPYQAELSALIQQRSEQYQRLVSARNLRARRLKETKDRLIGLTSSVRYIHEHHMVYLKNFLQRGHINPDYDMLDSFTRSGSESASEVDIIRAAVDIHNTVLDLLKFFQKVSDEPALTKADELFDKNIRDFFQVVNTFEDYSLDAQDGLLVEELLINGRYLQRDFMEVMQSNQETATLELGLDTNLQTAIGNIAKVRADIAALHQRNSNIVAGIEVLSILFTFLAAAAIAYSAFTILRRLRSIVTEASNIQDDLSHRITIDDTVPTEFSVVFRAFNDMAARIQTQIDELQSSRQALEQRVDERTSELKQSNLNLLNEIYERHQVATALQSSEQRFRSLFENTTDIIQSIDSESCKFLLVNPAWCQTLQYQHSQSPDLSLFDIVPPDQISRWRDALSALNKETSAVAIDGTLVARDGSHILVEGLATKSREEGQHEYHFFLHNITEKQQVEAERMRMQKLDSVGILAGGIAHDFNNLLSAVVGNLNLAALTCPQEGKLYERIKEAETAAYRASDLTRQLLTFSKGGEPIRELADLKVTIEDSVQFVLRGSNVRCVFELAEDLWPASVDLGQLSQVLQNLVINADQAMPDGGIVRVSAYNVDKSDTEDFPERGQPHICISVADQGIGISKDELNRIFDPYYSTKQSGNGLGLASAHSIIRKHQGWISVTSTPGKGSHFNVYLPAEPDSSVAETKDHVQTLHGDGSRILIMDDEESVRRIMTEILELHGYQVKATSGGQAALECYAENMIMGTPFALVITDLTVPGDMGGKELAERLHDIEPQVPILVASGYANDPIMANYKEHGFIGVISKPFRTHTLMEAVSIALSGVRA